MCNTPVISLLFYNEIKYFQVNKTLNVNQGDIVRVIAPARKSPDTALPIIKTYVESLGLVANISADIYGTIDPFYSNTDEYRANDLISALVDDRVKIIWCIRGGTGSIRLIPYLEEKLPAKLNHKIFIGYSDITVLHLYLQKKYGWQTLQGPMLEAIALEQYDRSSESVVLLERFIFEQQDKMCVSSTKLNENQLPVTRIESQVIGGNVALVEASIGTLWEVDARGKILFLEDVGESAYSIERSLDHMTQAGVFNSVDAVIFGDFTQADSNDLMNLVLQRFAQSVSFPVFRAPGIGHGTVNYPLPFSTFTEINHIESDSYLICVNNIQDTQGIQDIGSSSSSNIRISNSNFLISLIIVNVCYYFVK